MKKLLAKFKQLNPIIQLMLIYGSNFLLWLSFNLIWYKLWPADEPMSWKGITFKASFISFFCTLIFSWKLIKQCFFTNAQQ
jgi:hypothetical protein